MDTPTALTPPRRRLGARQATLLLAMLAVLASLLVPQAAVAASTGQISSADEKDFLALVNAERTERGLRPLDMRFGPKQVARDWSQTMAADDKLYHRPDLGGPFVGAWTRLGENVGVGWGVDSLHTAFMNSPGHRANVLGAGYRWVGVGVVTMDSGKIWVTFNFGAGDDAVADRFTASTSTSTPTPTSSPVPDGPFDDVPGDALFVEDIEWLADSGITSGCSSDGSRFCPDQAVVRKQMATFLVRALDLPTASGPLFDDVLATGTHALDIAALAAAGITAGCDPTDGLFCPNRRVTRGQMATFLVRALDLPAASGSFADVPSGSIHADDIQSLVAAGIAKGCGTNRFCPDASVTREQMAVFLRNAVG